MLEDRIEREAIRRERMSGKRDEWRRRKKEPSGAVYESTSLDDVGK